MTTYLLNKLDDLKLDLPKLCYGQNIVSVKKIF